MNLAKTYRRQKRLNSIKLQMWHSIQLHSHRQHRWVAVHRNMSRWSWQWNLPTRRYQLSRLVVLQILQTNNIQFRLGRCCEDEAACCTRDSAAIEVLQWIHRWIEELSFAAKSEHDFLKFQRIFLLLTLLRNSKAWKCAEKLKFTRFSLPIGPCTAMVDAFCCWLWVKVYFNVEWDVFPQLMQFKVELSWTMFIFWEFKIFTPTRNLHKLLAPFLAGDSSNLIVFHTHFVRSLQKKVN